jgi:excisionase family DNA binding protein
MTLQELKKLKHDIEDEISKREEKEQREFMELVKAYLRGKGMSRPVEPEPPNMTMKGNLISVNELAGRLGVAKSHIYHLTSTGKIPAVKIGRYNRYDFKEVLQALGAERQL